MDSRQTFVSIKQNYERVLEKIDAAASSVGRDGSSIKLVVVTKGHPIEAVEEAISAGAKILGENYVEEAITKVEAFPQWSGEWHMIGHIQSRKARQVCEYFDFVHSLDRLKIARRLNRFAGEAGIVFPVLLECNMSGEQSKYGWPAWEKDQWSYLLNEVGQVLEMTHLQVRGLMTMPPYSETPEQSRQYFIRLREIRSYFERQFPSIDWGELSMGMSADYEIAIQEGATMVRIGTEIMGPRL